MPKPESDWSSKVVAMLASILEAAKRVEAALEPYLVETDDRPEIAEDLLLILSSADDLIELVNPPRHPAEHFGMPAEALGERVDPPVIRHREHPDWDFMPWFTEKATYLKRGARQLVKTWRTSLEDVELKPGSPIEPREWLKYEIDAKLREVKHYALALFEETCGDRVSVEQSERT